MTKPFLIIIAVFLLFSGCEIDDDFGKALQGEDQGTLIAAYPVYPSSLTWYSSSEVLVHSAGLFILNVDDRSVTPVISADVNSVIGVAHDEKAIVTVLNQDYTFTLGMISLTDNEWTTLSGNVYYDYYNDFVAISGNLVAYSEISESLVTRHVYLHDIGTGERKMIFEQGTPIAFSPDRSELLYFDYYYNLYSYDLEDGIHTPHGQLNGNPIKVVWNESGIVMYAYQPEQVGGSLAISNVQSGQPPVRIANVPGPENIFISPDGFRFAYTQIQCSNPAYVYDCYDGPALSGLFVGDVPFTRGQQVGRFRLPDGGEFPDLTAGEFSPDQSRMIFGRSNGIYLITIPN